MADRPTCGQGLAAHAPLPAKLGELVASTSGILEIHMTALDPRDEDARQEHDAYQLLAREHREIAGQLLALGEEMAGYRDLPMGRHDMRVMVSPGAVEVFGKVLTAERELLALLERRVEQDQRMLEQMRAAGGAT